MFETTQLSIDISVLLYAGYCILSNSSDDDGGGNNGSNEIESKLAIIF